MRGTADEVRRSESRRRDGGVGGGRARQCDAAGEDADMTQQKQHGRAGGRRRQVRGHAWGTEEIRKTMQTQTQTQGAGETVEKEDGW